MKKLTLHAALLVTVAALAIPAATRAQSSVDGLWDAVVIAAGTNVPFRFEIATKGSEAQGFFFEGDRKVGSTSGSFADGVLKLDYDFLNTTLEVRLNGDELAGAYTNKRAGARPQDVRMRRFVPAAIADDNTPSLAGTWEMRRNADEVSRPATRGRGRSFCASRGRNYPVRFCASMATPVRWSAIGRMAS